MKEHVYDPKSWHSYTALLKDSLGRPLTREECSLSMKRYVLGVPVETVLRELEVESGNEFR